MTLAEIAVHRGVLAAVGEASRHAFPRECCGLLEGARGSRATRILRAHPARNLARRYDEFAVDPRDQFRLLRGLRGTGLSIVGCYHSHPGGRPEPSVRDLERASQPDFVWLIAAVSSARHVETGGFLFTGREFISVRLDRVEPSLPAENS